MISVMRLAQYLKDQKITPEAFGALVGASAFGVRKWMRRERTPRPAAMRKIQEVTKGEVTPADFFDEAPMAGAMVSGAQA